MSVITNFFKTEKLEKNGIKKLFFSEFLVKSKKVCVFYFIFIKI